MSDCGVCIGGEKYWDYPEFYDYKIVKARKEHRCVECRRTITIGQKYERYTQKFDGIVRTDKTCLDCYNIRKGLSCETYPAFGEMWSEIVYNFPQLKSTACLEKIPTASAKAYFLERWRQWKFGGNDEKSRV